MTCCFPYFTGDMVALQRLLLWIKDLGGCPAHKAVMVADAAVPYMEAIKLGELARCVFKSVDIVPTAVSVNGWPQGPNNLWLTAAEYCNANGFGPWLFMETDALPLKVGFLDALEAEYARCGARFMGSLVPNTVPGLPPLHLAGVAVYPSDAMLIMGEAIRGSPLMAFDLSAAPKVVHLSAETKLIHNLWGEIGNPPTFAEVPIPGTAVFCPAQVRPEAVIFHRNKDGSLLRLLRASMGIKDVQAQAVKNQVTPVFAFCRKDENLMAAAMAWLTKLHAKLPRSCVLHFDPFVTRASVIKNLAMQVFERVIVSNYPSPRPPYIGWPGAPNWAFMHACWFMDDQNSGPWFWIESDAVAIKPDWLDQIDAEYSNAGKPFMGTIFPNNTHMNGVGVYPAKVEAYAPSVFKMITEAWDFKCGPEIVPHAHKANHLIQHNDNGHNWGPKVFDHTNIGHINKTTVVYHPIKNDSLIKLLQTGKRP